MFLEIKTSELATLTVLSLSLNVYLEVYGNL